MLLLLNSDYGEEDFENEEDFETESLLRQSLSFKTYKMYLTAMFTHVL